MNKSLAVAGLIALLMLSPIVFAEDNGGSNHGDTNNSNNGRDEGSRAAPTFRFAPKGVGPSSRATFTVSSSPTPFDEAGDDISESNESPEPLETTVSGTGSFSSAKTFSGTISNVSGNSFTLNGQVFTLTPSAFDFLTGNNILVNGVRIQVQTNNVPNGNTVEHLRVFSGSGAGPDLMVNLHSNAQVNQVKVRSKVGVSGFFAQILSFLQSLVGGGTTPSPSPSESPTVSPSVSPTSS